MTNDKLYTIGIVCSGNTCRSPVTAAWLKRAISASPRPDIVRVWTAGMRVKRKDVGKKKVEESALEVARELGLSKGDLREMRKHRVRDLDEETSRTDLLVWISDPNKLSAIDRSSNGKTRSAEMKEKADKLGATLLVIPEADAAWEAKEAKAPPDEVRAAYYQQAQSLRRWSWMVFRFIPRS